MAKLVGVRTGTRNVLAVIDGNGESRANGLAVRDVWLQYDDGSEVKKVYEHPDFGCSGNTLLAAWDQDQWWLALTVEYKPGLLPDNCASSELKARTLDLPSGDQLHIPGGAVVSLFGGYYHKGEGRKAGALRELHEESGHKPHKLVFLGRLLLKPAWTSAYDDVYLGYSKKTSFEGAADESIFLRKWFCWDDAVSALSQLAGVGEDPDSTEVTGVHAPAFAALLLAMSQLKP